MQIADRLHVLSTETCCYVVDVFSVLSCMMIVVYSIMEVGVLAF